MPLNLQKLREMRNEKVAQMESIISASEGENLSAEQSDQFDKIEAEVSGLNEQIERLEKLDSHRARLDAPAPSVAQRQLTTEDVTREAVRRAVPGPEAVSEFENLGEFIYCVRFRPNDPRLEFTPAPRGDQRMDTGTDGGFAIPAQFRSQLLDVPTAPAAVRPRATVIPAGSPPDGPVTLPALDQTAAQNMYGGVVVSWIGEGGTKPETSFKMKEVTLNPNEVAAHVVLTDKFLRNWQAAGPLTERLLRGAIFAAEDDKFINGTGAGTPEGFLNANALGTVNRAVANQIAYNDLVAMDAELFNRGGQMPVWLTTKKRTNELRQITTPEGHHVWQENARVGIPPTLLGYEVVYVPRMPTLGAKGDIVLADLSYYLIKDGSGPFVAASEHVHFTQNKTVIKVFWNVDGQMWLTEQITEENGETFSPIVALDVP